MLTSRTATAGSAACSACFSPSHLPAQAMAGGRLGKQSPTCSCCRHRWTCCSDSAHACGQRDKHWVQRDAPLPVLPAATLCSDQCCPVFTSARLPAECMTSRAQPISRDLRGRRPARSPPTGSAPKLYINCSSACSLPRQNPVLAREDAWAHATGAPETGGLLLATPDAPRLLGEEYWQARCCRGRL